MDLKCIILPSVIILVFHTQLTQSGKKSDCSYSNFESPMKSMMPPIGFHDRKWPENEQETMAFCNAWPIGKLEAKKFSIDCLNGTSKTLTSMIIYALEKFNKHVCKNEKERNNFIAGGRCGNKAKKETMKCWQEFIILITNMGKLPNPKDKIPTLCCSFIWWKDCTLGAFRKAGNDTCSEANIEIIEQHIDKGAIDPMNFLCGDYDESDVCNKYYKKFDRTKINTMHETFFPALFEFFEKL